VGGAAPPQELRTARLVLRAWRDTDAQPLASMNADPAVMSEFLPGVLSTEESLASLARMRERFEQPGGTVVWAIEAPGVAPFVGFVGLAVPRHPLPFSPCVEILWRLAREHWGKGYATEGARAALDDGFDRVGLEEIVSFTVPANVRSRAVMERLGMRHAEGEDFDHPALPVGHRLRRHVLYRLRAVTCG
jgi:RimJ/RimL family protein N-acetyltransferase